jgi:hypothetical protein
MKIRLFKPQDGILPKYCVTSVINYSLFINISHNPPQHEQCQIDIYCSTAGTKPADFVQFIATVKPSKKYQRRNVWQRNQQKGIVLECLHEIQMQQLMYGPLCSAGGTLQPAQLMKQALR